MMFQGSGYGGCGGADIDHHYGIIGDQLGDGLTNELFLLRGNFGAQVKIGVPDAGKEGGAPVKAHDFPGISQYLQILANGLGRGAKYIHQFFHQYPPMVLYVFQNGGLSAVQFGFFKHFYTGLSYNLICI